MTTAYEGGPSRSGSLVDADVLRSLAACYGPAPAREFAARFVGLWPQRRDRIHQVLLTRDLESAADASLSLKSGAAMVGAAPLAELADQVHEALRAAEPGCRWQRMAELVKELDALGAATIDALHDFPSDLRPSNLPGGPSSR